MSHRQKRGTFLAAGAARRDTLHAFNLDETVRRTLVNYLAGLLLAKHIIGRKPQRCSDCGRLLLLLVACGCSRRGGPAADAPRDDELLAAASSEVPQAGGD